MSTITITCPECQANLKLPASLPAGKKIRCPKCRTAFAPSAEDATEEMAIETAVTSPKAIPRPRRPVGDETEEEEAIASPKRRSRRPGEEEEEAAQRRPGRKARRQEESEEDEDDRPSRSAVRRRKQAAGNPLLLWSLVGGGALLLIGGGIALFLILNQKKDDPPVAKGPPLGGPGNNPGMNRRFMMPPVPQPNAQGPVWAADPALVNQLAPEAAVQNYRIRPPKGYALRQQNLPGALTCAWKGTPRADGTTPLFVAAAGLMKPTEVNMTLDALIDANAAGLRRGFPGLVVSARETGQINGLSFIRARLEATAQGKKIRGFLYLAKDGRDFVSALFLDAEPHFAETGKVAEAAALTVRKP
jgi:hypothetical protein